ncbi:MAG: hypothetical protein SCH71_09815 [Desulfobulbaceae bacterium]|nr:hypothetical protein [Desulfobulbaceae bacterium]
MGKKTLLSWSSGKDSAWTLYLLQQDPGVELAGLFTVINRKYNRASMHATRLDLLQKQADAAGMELRIIELPDQCSNEECDAIMAEFIVACEEEGIECIAFGDLFLEDIRSYRENQLRRTKIMPLFPLWKIPTARLAEQMLTAGMEAYISSVDLARLPASFAGKKWSRTLLNTIPAEYDLCGENGEMHTIVVGGPMFHQTIRVRIGEIIERNGFAYADIIPV